jgi:hypothetical protein
MKIDKIDIEGDRLHLNKFGTELRAAFHANETPAADLRASYFPSDEHRHNEFVSVTVAVPILADEAKSGGGLATEVTQIFLSVEQAVKLRDELNAAIVDAAS